jgi:hypothetical protein
MCTAAGAAAGAPLGITSAAGFDDDFSIYRFAPRRQHAFEVKR